MERRRERTANTVDEVTSRSIVTRYVCVRSGVNEVPIRGAKVRSGGTHVFAIELATNSSAPGASARPAASNRSRSLS
jgi:hypothetical protein